MPQMPEQIQEGIAHLELESNSRKSSYHSQMQQPVQPYSYQQISPSLLPQSAPMSPPVSAPTSSYAHMSIMDI